MKTRVKMKTRGKARRAMADRFRNDYVFGIDDKIVAKRGWQVLYQFDEWVDDNEWLLEDLSSYTPSSI